MVTWPIHAFWLTGAYSDRTLWLRLKTQTKTNRNCWTKITLRYYNRINLQWISLNCTFTEHLVNYRKPFTAEHQSPSIEWDVVLIKTGGCLVCFYCDLIWWLRYMRRRKGLYVCLRVSLFFTDKYLVWRALLFLIEDGWLSLYGAKSNLTDVEEDPTGDRSQWRDRPSTFESTVAPCGGHSFN